jgi:hypothetical protein
MMSTHFLRVSAITVVAAALIAQSAVASSRAGHGQVVRSVGTDVRGEPKNEWPFTRLVSGRTTQAVAGAAVGQAPAGSEPKNEPPFTQPASIVVASSPAGFDWTDAAIGVVAGLGIALGIAGARLAMRKAPQTA